MKQRGCWIFLSHSSHDIQKVRMVRNEFERLGHNPLAFHLRCLTTETVEGRKELDSLIKREIDARELFVFCDSPDSEKSENVAFEHAYIINSGKEMIWSFDMTKDIESILKDVQEICREIEVYITYTRADQQIASILANLLEESDYAVWTPETKLRTGDNWADQIGAAIARCSYEGFYVILISKNSMKSDFVQQEIGMAMNFSGGENIIPVLVGDGEMPEQYAGWWPQYIRVPENPSREDFLPVNKPMDNTIKEYMKKTIRIGTGL